MIWIAWRYQRSIVLVLALVALVLVGFAAFIGVVQHRDLIEFMGTPCHGHQLSTPGRGDYCGERLVQLDNVKMYDTFIEVAGYVIAPLVGAILGLFALASEVDNRTVRLAWTQSISRTRWFAAKMSVGVVSVVVILVPTAIVLSWWNGTIHHFNLFGRETFGIAGWDLVAYGLFMFALTMLLGVIVRRVGWVLAASVVVFLVVAIAVPSRVRSHLVAPTVKWSEPYVVVKGDFTSASDTLFPPHAWLLFNGVAPRSTKGDPTLKEITATLPRVDSCVAGYPTKTEREYVKAELACYKKYGVENAAVYIGDNRFWTLQLREGLLYLAAAAVLAGGALVVIRRIEP